MAAYANPLAVHALKEPLALLHDGCKNHGYKGSTRSEENSEAR